MTSTLSAKPADIPTLDAAELKRVQWRNCADFKLLGMPYSAGSAACSLTITFTESREHPGVVPLRIEHALRFTLVRFENGSTRLSNPDWSSRVEGAAQVVHGRFGHYYARPVFDALVDRACDGLSQAALDAWNVGTVSTFPTNAAIGQRAGLTPRAVWAALSDVHPYCGR